MGIEFDARILPRILLMFHYKFQLFKYEFSLFSSREDELIHKDASVDILAWVRVVLTDWALELSNIGLIHRNDTVRKPANILEIFHDRR